MSKVRGRPRKNGHREPNGRVTRSAIDHGTPELQRRRLALAGERTKDNPILGLAELTTYPLGTLLSNGTISDEQHRAGCRYAWLYAVVHSRDSIASEAYRQGDGGGQGHHPDDVTWTAWLAEREGDLRELQRLLGPRQCRDAVDNLTVFGRLPRWAQPVIPTTGDILEARATVDALERLAAGRSWVGRAKVAA